MAESTLTQHSHCKNCGKPIHGYNATLTDLNTHTTRTTSIWLDNNESDTCPNGTPHQNTQHPTYQ